MECKFVIFILLVIVLVLISVDILISKKENFSTTITTQTAKKSVDVGFEDTHSFVEYSRNSDKLADMFKALDDIENKCQEIESKARHRQDMDEMILNDRVYNELEQQDKKINELKEIIKHLTIEKKRREKINSKCRNNTQNKLNKNYDYLKRLNKVGLTKDNNLNVDLNISDSLKAIKSNSLNTNNKNKNRCSHKGTDEFSLEKDSTEKCYQCDKDKLAKNYAYILNSFNK